ncbi:Retrovirus-related Pol polyprotein from transposon 412, partial [Anthophora retusa]
MDTRSKKLGDNGEARASEHDCSSLRQERDAALAEIDALRKEFKIHRPASDIIQTDSFTLKEALALVPIFNGLQPPVLTFTRACTRARDLLPPSAESTLTRLILTRLSGRAATAVEGERYLSVSDLCNRLKRVFGLQKTVDHYRGDLANIYMRRDEHILDFITRVKDIRKAIIDCDTSPISEIDNLTADCFIRGVNPQIEDIIESLRALRDAIIELNLSSVTISRTAIDDISWTIIRDALQELLEDTNVTLTICTNEIVIPIEEVRQDIIFENHTSAYAGHKGVTKTYRRIREKYYWPQMETDVTNFVTSCRECQRNKLTRVKTRNPMVLTDTPGQAFDKIALDVVGPLPTTPSDHQYILTMQDLLTKYSIAVPLKTTSAAETADALVDHLICKFGTPKAILTDQGTNFVNALMRAVTRRFRIQHTKTAAFHPQTNGSLERSHLVLTEYLKQYINNKNDWNNWLQCAMFSYNTSVHEGTLYTPHELIFGHKAREKSLHDAAARLENERSALVEVRSALKSDDLNRQLIEELAAVRRELDELKRAKPGTTREIDLDLAGASTRPLLSDLVSDNGAISTYSLREAVEAVPSYDGTNISVFQFIRACKRAKELVSPHAEGTLARLIINRLKGRAYLAIEDEPCSSIRDLCDIMRIIFGPQKNVEQYRGALASTYQLPDEHIIDYVSRIKDLRSAIIDCERGSRHVDLLEVDDFALRCFSDGLIPEIRHLLMLSQPSTLSEAFVKARELYRRLELDRERQRTAQKATYSAKAAQRNPEIDIPLQRTATAPRASVPKTCSYCKNIGHTIDECHKRRYNNAMRNGGIHSTVKRATVTKDATIARTEESVLAAKTRETGEASRLAARTGERQTCRTFAQTSEPPRSYRDNYDQTRRDYREPQYQRDSRQPSRPTKSCSYCKYPGHDIHECRKREYNNKRNQGNEQTLSPNPDRRREASPQKSVRNIVATESQESA